MLLNSYNVAKSKLLSGDYSVEDFFIQNDCSLELGYCKLLQGDIIAANEEFLRIENLDFRANWALKLLQFIREVVINLPSYFQVRNFLEIDLNLLIRAGQPDFVNNIINAADLFYSVNPESYKFISRVLMNNEYLDLSLHFLSKAKDKFYYDPEMHFMLANCYLKLGNLELAEKAAKNCLNILPEYFPAVNLLGKIK